MMARSQGPLRQQTRHRASGLLRALGCLPVVWLAFAHPLRADPADLCRAAATAVADSSGVPFAVLLAITQTETGRTRGGETQPWPWTVNMEGEGHWFDTRDAALAYVVEQYDRGARSFDVGCFQINFRWHGENFASIEEMFDPLANTAYAARFLAGLHRETGDWSAAAGAFHSRTEVHATRYRATFDRFHTAALAAGADTLTSGYDDGVQLASAEALPRTNSFPLLQTGNGTRSLGSLVPLSP